MTRKEIWKRAEECLHLIYGDDAALKIVNRFLEEKKAFEHLGIGEYFDQLASIVEESIANNEGLIVKNTISSCLTSSLLGASEVNPLPVHYHCKKCGDLIWAEVGSCAFDMKPRMCECGGSMAADGFDLCWQTYLPYGERLNVKDPVPKTYKDLFEVLTKKHFQVSLLSVAQVCNFLGEKTGVYPHEIDLSCAKVKEQVLSGKFDSFPPKLAEFLRDAYSVVQPQTYSELLQLFSLSKGTNTWRNNAKDLLRNGVCKLCKIPTSRDELFLQIRDAMTECGFYDSGFAYDVMNKTRKGYYREYGMDESSRTLYMLGFDKWFVDYLSRVAYLAPKALSVLELRFCILLTWYQTYYPKQYEMIGDESIWEGGQDNG